MARPSASRINARSTLAAAALALFILALIPSRTSARWTSEIRNPVETIVAPIQATLSKLVRYQPQRPGAPDADAEALRAQLQEYQLRYHRLTMEIERLNRQIADLSRGAAVMRDLPVRQIAAAVIGSGADPSDTTLKVRAGTREGVTVNSVAVVGGVHLIGRVVETRRLECHVRPITDRASDLIQGSIYLTDDVKGPLCALRPTGDGTLRGDVEFQADPTDPASAGGPPIKPGMTVRLEDDNWPPHSWALVVGLIEEVEVLDNQRRRITVRPVFRPDRVSQVTLRVLGEAPGEGGEGRGG
jgi:hypothetical protein